MPASTSTRRASSQPVPRRRVADVRRPPRRPVRQTHPGDGKQFWDLAFYRCAGLAAPPLRELIRVAGARWAIEECLQAAKNEAGLDQCQVRDCRAWYAPTSPWPWPPLPTSLPPAPPPARRRRGTRGWPRRSDPAVGQQDPPPARRPRPTPHDQAGRRSALVDLAPRPTTSGPRLPLPTPRRSTTTAVDLLLDCD
jgi:hypothetical protein